MLQKSKDRFLKRKRLLGTDASEIKRPISEEKKTTWHGWARILFISSEIGYSISEDRLPPERLGYAGWGGKEV